jgi:hypothetical protein
MAMLDAASRIVLNVHRHQFESASVSHDEFGSHQSEITNAIESHNLDRDADEKQVPTFSLPAPGLADTTPLSRRYVDPPLGRSEPPILFESFLFESFRALTLSFRGAQRP